MPEVAYLSTTGEIKVPLQLRTKLGLKAGEKFEVDVTDGALMFRRIALAGDDQVEQFIAWAKNNGKNQGPRKITIAGKPSPRRLHATAKALKKKGDNKVVVRRR